MSLFSIYVHIPFCQHRCCYCDFNTYAGLEDLIPAYVTSLCREIALLASATDMRLPVTSIFFGGGTPSLLPPDALEEILRAIADHFDLQSNIEITLEANPGTLSRDYLQALRELNVNRLSMGMQSANPEELDLLERKHDFTDVINGVVWAREAGFANLNLDLIFGLPGQTLQTWQQNFNLAISLGAEHLSLYALTLEHGTPMQSWVSKGLLAEPDADLAAEMYEWAEDRLADEEYEQYEISNWVRRNAKEDYRCRHNLQYWRNLPYLGFGAGAHGYAGGVRTANVLSPLNYVKRCLNGEAGQFPRTPATVNVQSIDQETEMGETMMMGLRLTQEGVSPSLFKRRFGKSMQDVYGLEITELLKNGLVEWKGEDEKILRLKSQGRLLGNQVFMKFI